MNSNFILLILVLIIIYLYYNQVKRNITSIISTISCEKLNKINPKDFNPVIHHPAAL